jgi:DNA-binding winged helix-turn-helix (wHTH) protein
MGEARTRFHEFGRFRVDTAAWQVRYDGKVVPLPPMSFDILVLLLENRGRLVKRKEIENLWDSVEGHINTVNYAVMQLRKALAKASGENAKNFLRTVHGQGYLLVPDVELTNEENVQTSSTDRPHARTRLRNTPALLDLGRAQAMVKAYDFYHADWNRQGRGLLHLHRYDSRLCGSARVVLDHATGLMWEYGSSGFLRLGFPATLEYVRSLNENSFGGFRNWRLPTLEESMSLMTAAQPDEAPDKGQVLHLDPVFERCEPFLTWTSDVLDYEGRYGWIVLYWHGTCTSRLLGNNGYVKAVRSDVT